LLRSFGSQLGVFLNSSSAYRCFSSRGLPPALSCILLLRCLILDVAAFESFLLPQFSLSRHVPIMGFFTVDGQFA